MDPRASHPHWAQKFLTDEDFAAITQAIAAAEAGTSAEIRVHLERRVHHRRWRRPDALTRARAVFAHLGMHRTAERHGVLVYLALEDRKLALVGDEGIHARVGDDYWAGVRDAMLEELRAGRPRAAILVGIARLGRALGEHFPRRPGDANELGDQVSIG